MPFTFRRREARGAGNGYNVPVDMGPSTSAHAGCCGEASVVSCSFQWCDTFVKVVGTDASFMETDQVPPDRSLA